MFLHPRIYCKYRYIPTNGGSFQNTHRVHRLYFSSIAFFNNAWQILQRLMLEELYNLVSIDQPSHIFLLLVNYQ